MVASHRAGILPGCGRWRSEAKVRARGGAPAPCPMFRTLMSSASPAALSAAGSSSSKSVVSLTEPLTRRSCIAIRHALEAAYGQASEHALDPAEAHAAVLVPLCNVDGRPGVLLEVRGKLRTHSGEVRYAAAALCDCETTTDPARGATASPAARSMRYAPRPPALPERGCGMARVACIDICRTLGVHRQTRVH